MSGLEEIFKQAIKDTQKSKGKFTLMVGTVTAINDDLCTVDDYEDVRLNAIDSYLESQFTVYPKIDSKVIIGRIEGQDDCFIVQVSEIEKVVIKIDNQIFEMKDGKFTIKKGNINLKSILNKGLNQLQSAVIITPAGNGSFSPADILIFEQINIEVNQLLN